MVNTYSCLTLSLLLIGSVGEIISFGWSDFPDEKAIIQSSESVQAIERAGNDAFLQCTEVVDRLEEAKDVPMNVDELLKTLEKLLGTSSQINILDLQYEEDCLFINFSKELVAYGGGNEIEYQVIRAIKQWAFEDSEIAELTILVEGKIEGFPEGSIIKGVTRDSYEKEVKEDSNEKNCFCNNE